MAQSDLPVKCKVSSSKVHTCSSGPNDSMMSQIWLCGVSVRAHTCVCDMSACVHACPGQCQLSIPRNHTTCFRDKVSLTDTWSLAIGLDWPAAPRDPPVSAPQHGDYTYTPLCPAMVMVSRGANTGPHTYKSFSDCATSPDSVLAFIRGDDNTMLPKVLTCTLFKLRHYLNSSLMARACTELFCNL